MSTSVQGKNVLITGANRGIGRAILVEALSRGAAKVYAAVRNLDSAAPLVAEFGDRVTPLVVDLEKPATISAAAHVANDVHIVINNAGVLRASNLLSPEAIESLEFEMKVNVYGLIHMAQDFAGVLKANGGGAFVQLNSVVSVKSFADVATYSASKAASYSITQALREVLGSQNTQVVSVHPGPILTDMAREAGFEEVAEPPSVVANAIFDALESGDFHVWPDSMAKQFGEQYATYANNVIEQGVTESSQ